MPVLLGVGTKSHTDRADSNHSVDRFGQGGEMTIIVILFTMAAPWYIPNIRTMPAPNIAEAKKMVTECADKTEVACYGRVIVVNNADGTYHTMRMTHQRIWVSTEENK